MERLRASPFATPYIPSVAMKGGTFSRATSSPLTRPGSSPAATPTAEPASMETSGAAAAACSSRMTMAESTDESPITKPTEMSIPPVMMTNVSPVASSSAVVEK